jgi:hypothetical protein
VPDVEAAKVYFDEFLPMVGYVRQWETAIAPRTGTGRNCSSIQPPRRASIRGSGPGSHTSPFSSKPAPRSTVSTSGSWPAATRCFAPRLFPEYGDTFYATFFLDPHGFHLEVVTFENV